MAENERQEGDLPPVVELQRYKQTCQHLGQILVDPDLPKVTCGSCGEKLDPYWALRRLASEYRLRDYKANELRRLEQERLERNRKARARRAKRSLKADPARGGGTDEDA